jgi:drug/metabolite transporter (DMT)-like permease
MRINAITLVGIALIVLGIVALAYQGITYTSRENVIDIGPFHATAETQKTIPLSPLLGVLALVGGVVLVVVGAKKA